MTLTRRWDFLASPQMALWLQTGLVAVGSGLSPILAPQMCSGSVLELPNGDMTGIYSLFLE